MGNTLDLFKTYVKLISQPKESYRDDLEDSLKAINELAKTSKPIHDSYGNELLAIGNDNKTDKFDEYSFTNSTLNWTLWTALYNDSWVFKRAIDKPAQDEVRCGITISGDNDYDKVYKRLKKCNDDLIQLLMWGGLYGGSIACLMFDGLNDDDYKRPINIEKIRNRKMTMYVVDRWYGVSPSYNKNVKQMSSEDFGKPRFYDVTLADGSTIRFHHDYVLRYEHRQAPKLIKNGQLQGWGYAEGAHILHELSRDEKLKSSIQSLVDKSLIEVIKMSGMRGIFLGSDKGNEEQLQKRLEMVNWARNYNSLTFLDRDDDYIQHQFSGLGGLSDILQQNMWQIAAALEMSGVLYGDLKGGFSNDSDALERYDETIHNRCEAFVRPIYYKLLKLFFKLEGINEEPEFEFNSLLVKKNDKERIESIESFVNLLSRLLSDGVITAKKYAKLLQDYSKNNKAEFEFDEDELKEIDENIREEMENIDLNE